MHLSSPLRVRATAASQVLVECEPLELVFCLFVCFVGLIQAEPTRVELHEGGDQLFDGQRVVLHHFRESLSTRLDSRVGDEQHLHQLGNKVGVPDVVLAADEHHQKGDDVLDARLIQNLGRIPGRKGAV